MLLGKKTLPGISVIYYGKAFSCSLGTTCLVTRKKDTKLCSTRRRVILKVGYSSQMLPWDLKKHHPFRSSFWNLVKIFYAFLSYDLIMSKVKAGLKRKILRGVERQDALMSGHPDIKSRKQRESLSTTSFVVFRTNALFLVSVKDMHVFLHCSAFFLLPPCSTTIFCFFSPSPEMASR